MLYALSNGIYLAIGFNLLYNTIAPTHQCDLLALTDSL
jgi:hypothetical protein